MLADFNNKNLRNYPQLLANRCWIVARWRK